VFSFSDNSPKILEHNVSIEAMEEKHHDKYMIATNIHQVDGWFYGDIVAFLTPTEYSELQMPKEAISKYRIWVGDSIKMDGVGIYGLYL
jgi:hypothetical protein